MDIGKTFDHIIDLFKAKEESILGIDLGSASLKVVQARKKDGRAVLETYGEIALGPYVGMEIGRAVRLTPEKLGEALKDVLREANTTTKESGVAVPLSSSIVNIIKVPKVSKENFSQVVALEARKYIPVPLAEVNLDWQVVSGDERINSETVSEKPEVEDISENKDEGKTKNEVSEVSAVEVYGNKVEEVLVVAVHKDLISNIRQVLHNTEIKVLFMELESFSVARSIIDDLDSVVLILDHGASSTKIYVFDKGVLKISHNISIGSQDVTLSISRSTGMPVAEAERIKRSEGFSFKHGEVDTSRIFYSSLAYVFSETAKTIKDFQSKHGKIVKEIILTGAGVNLKGFSEALAQNVDVPIKFAHAFQRLKYPAFMDKVIREAGPSFSVATGAVLRALEDKG